MVLKTGWIEKREHERKEAAWEVTYQVLDPQEAREVPRQPPFQDLESIKGNGLGFHGLTRDISQGGLCIVADQDLKEGSTLIVFIHHHQYPSSLVAVAKVAHNTETVSNGRFRYLAGLKILAVDEESLNRILETI